MIWIDNSSTEQKIKPLSWNNIKPGKNIPISVMNTDTELYVTQISNYSFNVLPIN